MTYRVQFFDTNGKLICWYSTGNKAEAYKLAVTGKTSVKSKNWYAEVEQVYA
jgi:hypothetical protein